MIHDKCIFQISFINFQKHMLLVHIGIASMRQFQCAPTTYAHSINDDFHHIQFFSNFSTTFLMFQCNEHVEMNKFFV